MNAYVDLPLGDEDEAAPSAPSPPPTYAPRPPTAPPKGGSRFQASAFEVTVSDPSKQGSGMNAFVSYKVTCKTSLQQYENATNSVTRRYNHFMWLHAQLAEQYPCHFIPALPEKSGITPLFNRFQEDFVESRRIALEQYLQRLVQHPVIQDSKPLQTFFEGSEDVMKLPEEKKPSFFGSIMKDMSIAPKLHPPPDEEFDGMKTYIKEMEGQLSELHKFLERLVRRRKDLASSLAELGLTLITLGNHEQQSGDQESATASKAFTDLGSCCDHLAISIQHQANDEARKALMVVDDWLRVIYGVKEALKTRAMAAGHTLMLQQEVDRKTRTLASGQQGKVSISESDVMEASRRVEESRQREEMLGQRVREEMRRLKVRRNEELRQMLCGFVSVQLKYGSEVQSSWESVLPSLVNGIDPTALQH